MHRDMNCTRPENAHKKANKMLQNTAKLHLPSAQDQNEKQRAQTDAGKTHQPANRDSWKNSQICNVMMK